MKFYPYQPPSMADLIYATLTSGRNTKAFRDILSERHLAKYKKSSIQVELSRLKKKQLVGHSPLGWFLTKSGKAKMQARNKMNYFQSPFPKGAPENTIVSFDIPETKRIYRDWLRTQLKIFGYNMLQQSLWIGPGPLPSYFIKRIEDFSIRKQIKIFKVKKSQDLMS